MLHARKRQKPIVAQQSTFYAALVFASVGGSKNLSREIDSPRRRQVKWNN